MLIVSGLDDKTAWIWGMNLCNSKVLLIDNNPNVNAGMTIMAILPDACFVTAGSLDTIVCIWDVVTGMLLDHLHGHGNLVYWFCYWQVVWSVVYPAIR